MSKLDELIQEALVDQDETTLAETRELGYLALGLSQFSGKHGWVTWLIMVVQGVMFAGGVYCAIQFYTSSELLAALKWGITSAVLLIMAINLKLSLAPQMQADRVIREVKRLELLLLSRS